MLTEREILVSVLKKTLENSNVSIEDICEEARMPRAIVLEILNKLSDDSLLGIKEDRVIVNGEQRLKIAVKAVNLGCDIERVAKFLSWAEFERFSRLSFELNDFRVVSNFRFTLLKKRWEIDIIGVKRPMVISADCKHWRRKWSGSASAKAARGQAERTKALAEASRRIKSKIGINGWMYAYFIPAVLSLFPSQYKFYEKTPIVPILQLKDFLQNIIIHLDEVNYFYVSYA
jgi:hypothetical protein